MPALKIYLSECTFSWGIKELVASAGKQFQWIIKQNTHKDFIDKPGLFN